MSMDPIRGRFVWYDLMTPDTAGAVAFYQALTGWGTASFDGDYTMLTLDEIPIGGLMTLPEKAREMGAPPHWLPYVGVDDADATAALATSLGGSVLVEPQDIPEVGRFAVIRDPQGAVLAVFEPNVPENMSPNDPNHTGEVSWHELNTTDHAASFGFYEQLFGWQRGEAMDMGEGGLYQLFGLGGDTLGGMSDVAKAQGFPPHWLVYFRVADVDALVDTITGAGGTILNGPMDIPGEGRILQGCDPQGAAFALHSCPAGE